MLLLLLLLTATVFAIAAAAAHAHSHDSQIAEVRSNLLLMQHLLLLLLLLLQTPKTPRLLRFESNFDANLVEKEKQRANALYQVRKHRCQLTTVLP